jgi:hypothetical protein
MRKPREIIPERVYEFIDKHTRYYEIIDGGGSPSVEVQALDGGVGIMQDNGDTFDVIELSYGQAYDLLYTLSKALDIPVRAS